MLFHDRGMIIYCDMFDVGKHAEFNVAYTYTITIIIATLSEFNSLPMVYMM